MNDNLSVKTNILKKYASIIIEIGINVQKNENLIISAPVEALEFVRALQEEAYLKGAADIKILWADHVLSRNAYLYAPKDVLLDIENNLLLQTKNKMIMEKNASVISISSPVPGSLQGVSTSLLKEYENVVGSFSMNMRKKQMSNEIKWCVCAYPNKYWAKQLFPNLDETQAFDKLLELILKCAYITPDNDPLREHKQNNDNLAYRAEFLNRQNFEYLHFTTELGTDLKVGLPENYVFLGGKEYSASNCEFKANIPTEEVFSAPHRLKVDGVVYASKALNYNNYIIENIKMEFKEGKAISCSSSTHENILKDLIATDEYSAYLGEVALVPHSSPISQTGLIFNNTLFDENASCHLALGMAYPTCVKNGESFNTEEALHHGLNVSKIHVDFMFGTAHTKLIGFTKDYREVLIMENGEFVI